MMSDNDDNSPGTLTDNPITARLIKSGFIAIAVAVTAIPIAVICAVWSKHYTIAAILISVTGSRMMASQQTGMN